MFKLPLYQRFLICFAVLTTVGILVHDTKFDEAVALALPVATISFAFGTHLDGLGDNAHTHVERASMAQAFAGIPRVQARDDHRRYYLPKSISRSSGHFGSSSILWPHV